jgi:hypothetical protein
MKRPLGTMSWSLFCSILTQAQELGVKTIVPYLMGEPLMDPDIWRRLDKIEEMGFQTRLNTNGSLLIRQYRFHLLSYTALKEIIVSLHAVNSEEYRQEVGQEHFKQVCFQTSCLVEEAKALQAAAQIKVIYRKTQPFVKEFVATWKENAYLADFLNYGGLISGAPIRARDKSRCFLLDQNDLCVLWDGRVSLCCLDCEGQIIFGDLNKESLLEVWTRFNQSVQKDFPFNLCKLCNFVCLAK